MSEEKLAHISIDVPDSVAAWLNENVVGQTISDFVVSLIRGQIKKRSFSDEELELVKAMGETLREITNGVEGWYAMRDVASAFRTKMSSTKVTNEQVSSILRRLGFTERDRLKHGGYTHVLVRQALLERLRKTRGYGQMHPEPKKTVSGKKFQH